jgi:UDP-glucose 4-epimerase
MAIAAGPKTPRSWHQELSPGRWRIHAAGGASRYEETPFVVAMWGFGEAARCGIALTEFREADDRRLAFGSAMFSKRVLVTGGAGFVGSHVAEAFLAEGCDVLAVDDLSTGRKQNVPREAGFEQLDIAVAEAVTLAVNRYRPDVVCHLAAQASVTVSVRDPVRDLRTNVEGTANVCRAAAEARAPVLYASTGGALYGDRAPVPTPETFFPEPHSPYGASKLGAELYVTTWGRLYGLPNVALRLGNVYGPRQNPQGEAGVVAIFSGHLLRGKPPTIFGDGKQTRDYVHAADVASAFVLAAESQRAGVFNVGWGRGTTVVELFEMLQQVAGTSLGPRFEPLRPGELLRSVIDSSAIEEALKWRPRIEVREGLAATFRWYKNSAEAAS